MKSRFLGVGFFLFAILLLYLLNRSPFVARSSISKNGVYADLVRASSGAEHLVHFFTVGSVAAASDVQWIQALQSIDDRCPEDLQKSGCRSVFGALAITALKLDPKNGFVARHGLTLADVAVIDVEAGTQILELGLKQNSNNRDFNYWAGYHYMAELGQSEKAAQYFYRAAQLGAPRWVYSLAAKLYSDSGKLAFAQKLLVEEIKNSSDELYTDRLKKRLAELETKYQQSQRTPASGK